MRIFWLPIFALALLVGNVPAQAPDTTATTLATIANLAARLERLEAPSAATARTAALKGISDRLDKLEAAAKAQASRMPARDAVVEAKIDGLIRALEKRLGVLEGAAKPIVVPPPPPPPPAKPIIVPDTLTAGDLVGTWQIRWGGKTGATTFSLSTPTSGTASGMWKGKAWAGTWSLTESGRLYMRDAGGFSWYVDLIQTEEGVLSGQPYGPNDAPRTDGADFELRKGAADHRQLEATLEETQRLLDLWAVPHVVPRALPRPAYGLRSSPTSRAYRPATINYGIPEFRNFAAPTRAAPVRSC